MPKVTVALNGGVPEVPCLLDERGKFAAEVFTLGELSSPLLTNTSQRDWNPFFTHVFSFFTNVECFYEVQYLLENIRMILNLVNVGFFSACSPFVEGSEYKHHGVLATKKC